VVRKAVAATAAVKSVISHATAQLQVKVLPRPHHEAEAEAEVVSEAASEVVTMAFRTTGPQTALNVVVQTTMREIARRKPSNAMHAESWCVSCPPAILFTANTH